MALELTYRSVFDEALHEIDTLDFRLKASSLARSSSQTRPLQEVGQLPHGHVPGERLDAKVSVLGQENDFSKELSWFSWNKGVT